jgi:uncharacterized protein YoxC
MTKLVNMEFLYILVILNLILTISCVNRLRKLDILIKNIYEAVTPLKSNLQFLQSYTKTVLEQTKRIIYNQNDENLELNSPDFEVIFDLSKITLEDFNAGIKPIFQFYKMKGSKVISMKSKQLENDFHDDKELFYKIKRDKEI